MNKQCSEDTRKNLFNLFSKSYFSPYEDLIGNKIQEFPLSMDPCHFPQFPKTFVLFSSHKYFAMSLKP